MRSTALTWPASGCSVRAPIRASGSSAWSSTSSGSRPRHPTPPYDGLWSRIAGFRPEHLAEFLLDRTVVRASVMRGTIHLVSARDARILRPFAQPLYDQDLATSADVAPHLDGVDLVDLVTEATGLFAAEPLTKAELRTRLAVRWPRHEPDALARAVHDLVPLIQIPPRGVWGASGSARSVTTESWLGRPVLRRVRSSDIVRRYLAAFGPASALYAQRWSGVRGLAATFERLRPELHTFVDEHGRELFDLPDAPRPDPDTPAPPRFVAEFDNLTLSHADRSRVTADLERRRLVTVNGIVHATVLVDGFVAGTWKLRTTKASTIVTVAPFHRLPKAATAALEREGRALAAFTAPDTTAEVRFLPVA